MGVNRGAESEWSEGQSSTSVWTDRERAGITACLQSGAATLTDSPSLTTGNFAGLLELLVLITA